MKAFFILFGFILTFSLNTMAQTLNNMSDAQQLGSMAGLGYACDSKKLKDFELISSYIIGNQFSNDKARTEAFKEYAAEKLRTYNVQKKEPVEPCSKILDHFNNLPIFQSKIYKDGTVQLPDGKLIRPQTQSQQTEKRNVMQKGK